LCFIQSLFSLTISACQVTEYKLAIACFTLAIVGLAFLERGDDLGRNF
jgi:hypothetical protein